MSETFDFTNRPTTDGVRNYLAWGWTDADLYRAIEVDSANREEYLQELAQRRLDLAADTQLAHSLEDEVKVHIAKLLGV